MVAPMGIPLERARRYHLRRPVDPFIDRLLGTKGQNTVPTSTHLTLSFLSTPYLGSWRTLTSDAPVSDLYIVAADVVLCRG